MTWTWILSIDQAQMLSFRSRLESLNNNNTTDVCSDPHSLPRWISEDLDIYIQYAVPLVRGSVFVTV